MMASSRVGRVVKGLAAAAVAAFADENVAWLLRRPRWLLPVSAHRRPLLAKATRQPRGKRRDDEDGWYGKVILGGC